MSTLDQVKQAIINSQASGTAAEVLNTITVKSIQTLHTEKWTYAGLASVLGTAKVTELDGILKQVGLEWVRMQLAGGGINFADPEFQTQLTNLKDANVIPEQDASVLSSMGISYKSHLENAGGDSTTEEEVQLALTDIANENNVYDQKSIRLSIVINPNNKIVSYQEIESTSEGKLGNILVNFGTANADNINLPEKISNILTILVS